MWGVRVRWRGCWLWIPGAHGNFRAWAKITHHLTAGMKESGRILDEDLLRWSYSKLRQRPLVA